MVDANINAKIARGPRYVVTVVKNHVVLNAMALESVCMENETHDARRAEAQVFANTTSKNITAETAMALDYANMVVNHIYVQIVQDQRFANTGV